MDQISLDELLQRPELFLDHFDLRRGRAVLLRVSPEAIQRDCWTARRAAQDCFTVPVAELAEAARDRPAAAPSFIFMTDWCGSTLFAQAVGALAGRTVFSEPEVFMRLAVDRRSLEFEAGQRPLWREALDCGKLLMARGFLSDRRTIVKEQPLTNYLIPQLLEGEPEARGLFLYGTLADYLAAAFASPYRLQYARRRVQSFKELQTSPLLKQALSTALDDGRIAALHWLHQIDTYGRCLQGPAGGRLLPVSSDRFFAAPGAVLAEALAFLGAAVPPAQIAAAVEGPLFARHAKDPQRPFNKSDRDHHLAEVRARHGLEIREASAWAAEYAETLALRTGLGDLLGPAARSTSS